MKPGVIIGIVVIIGVVVVGGFFLWKYLGHQEEVSPPILPPITPPEIITPTPIAEPTSITPTIGTPLAEGTEYTVQPKDTLWKIAKHFYNDGAKYKIILEANKEVIKNEDEIKPGMKLIIPPASAGEITTKPPREIKEPTPVTEKPTVASAGSKIYTVRKGDGLSEIAKKFYKNGGKKYQQLIFEANRDKLATLATTLKPGMKLVIPPLEESPEPKPKTSPKAPTPGGAPE